MTGVPADSHPFESATEQCVEAAIARLIRLIAGQIARESSAVASNDEEMNRDAAERSDDD